MKTVFLRLIEADEKATALLQAVRTPERASDRRRFELDPQSFSSVPRSPFAYWVSGRVRRLFKELPPFEAEGRTAKCGMGTLDDFRFLRSSWELRSEEPSSRANRKWVCYVGPGRRSLAYSDVVLMLDWTDAGRELKCFVEERVGSASRKIQSEGFYFRPGLTWPLRGSRFSCQAVPSGCVFSVAGKMAFVPLPEQLHFLALFNSAAFDSLIALFAGKVGGVQYEAGLIQSVPVPRMIDSDRDALATLARRAWSLRRLLDTRNETSHAFTLPALLQVTGDTLTTRSVVWADRRRTLEEALAGIQAEIDERCFALYGIDEADRRSITEGFGSVVDESAEPSVTDLETNDEIDEDLDLDTDVGILAAELMSWAAGVAFGRFDVRLATGERELPGEPEPFEPLPVSSLAMLPLEDGPGAPSVYPFVLPENGILVDDAGHPRDLTAAVRAVFDVVFREGADSWWDEVARLLDPKDHDLRGWLGSRLFEDHLKRHSKGRRKAPILWQLATPSGRYSVWLYVHRLTRDSLFQLQNDVIAPKVAHEERQLADLVQGAGGSQSAMQRKEIAAQAAFVEELRALLDEVKRVVPLWNPLLDDGVVLAMAPLWRLVPHYKPWQKELKGKCDELAAAKYDWSHLAMHLWPERVVPKCASQRSLAIAHGLEDVFWVEDAGGEWTLRPIPTRPVAEIVRERTSAAVKAALKSLLEAPLATTGGARGRVRRNGSIAGA
jgi:hypothetical protein